MSSATRTSAEFWLGLTFRELCAWISDINEAIGEDRRKSDANA
jgi:hypothetical protein